MAEALGVKFLYNTRIESLALNNNEIVGVSLWR
jgi:hypothetical protein